MSITKEIKNKATPFNISSQRGGKEAITRILKAYGFSTRQALCDRLGVSQSTMANRWMRDTFPHDWLIACHLDTGVSMLWLATGSSSESIPENNDKCLNLQFKKISNGIISNISFVHYDDTLMPPNAKKPSLIEFEGSVYLVNKFDGEINDGTWLIKIDGFASIRKIYRLPGSRLRVENGTASFECEATEIEVQGKVIGKTVFKE